MAENNAKKYIIKVRGEEVTRYFTISWEAAKRIRSARRQ